MCLKKNNFILIYTFFYFLLYKYFIKLLIVSPELLFVGKLNWTDPYEIHISLATCSSDDNELARM